MSDTLQHAFDEASKLAPNDQEAFAEFILEELNDRKAWAAKFAAHPHAFDRLAEEARAEHAAGRTRPLEESL